MTQRLNNNKKYSNPIKLCLKIENQMHKICKYFISYNYIITILYRKFLKEPIRNCRSKSIITKIKISVNGFNLLKLQYFGHLIRRANSLEKTLMLGKIEGRRRRERQKMRWFDGITDSMDMSLSKLPRDGEGQGSLICCSPWGHKELDLTKQLNKNTH